MNKTILDQIAEFNKSEQESIKRDYYAFILIACLMAAVFSLGCAVGKYLL